MKLLKTKLIKTTLNLILLLTFCLPAFADSEFTLTSPDISEGKTLDISQVYNGFGCEGKNISPELNWENAPEKTKSFAITVYDPDAPTGSGWWHWTAFNIPNTTTKIERGAKLSGDIVQGRTDFGKSEFGGACPPKGDKAHRYIFTIFALDVEKIELDKMAPGALVGFQLNAHAIKKASITAKYGR